MQSLVGLSNTFSLLSKDQTRLQIPIIWEIDYGTLVPGVAGSIHPLPKDRGILDPCTPKVKRRLDAEGIDIKRYEQDEGGEHIINEICKGDKI